MLVIVLRYLRMRLKHAPSTINQGGKGGRDKPSNRKARYKPLSKTESLQGMPKYIEDYQLNLNWTLSSGRFRRDMSSIYVRTRALQ